MFIYSHNPLSQGARRLAQELGIRCIKHHNSRFTGRRAPYVINWGASALPLPWGARVRLLNAPGDVERVSNKLTFFEDMFIAAMDIIPQYTINIEVAQEWKDNGTLIVERHLLRGSRGAGIRMVGAQEELQAAPLYTQYIKKATEYRIHVFDGEVIDSQRKVVKKTWRQMAQNPNWKIRTHDNGFIYQRQGVDIPPLVVDAAERAMEASGLLFGAIDVIWNNKQKRAYVLEINTAPGLEGQTVLSYAQAIRDWIR